ncbi:DUF6029 family protein [Bernardetia sp. OM2101]|uniref:DUF6029 family protein n=1 Tax=Bernardetia sp. OM2101 TaxID=3344876 RepID=UPI0035CF957C
MSNYYYQTTLLFLVSFFFLIINPLVAQNQDNQNSNIDFGTLTGSVQTDFRYYVEDSIIGAAVPLEKIGFNNYFTLNYERGNFRAGVRYETYLPALLGYPSSMRGTGIARRYMGYTLKGLDVTVGNLYEQFGSGMILRAQEDRFIGIDNSIDGLRVKYDFNGKARATGIIGRQRNGFTIDETNSFGKQNRLSAGVVRGLDLELYLHEIFKPKLTEEEKESQTPILNPLSVTLSGSFVSKYEDYLGTIEYINRNVDAYSGRLFLNKGGFSTNVEYVYKASDPSKVNSYIDKTGTGFLMNMQYSRPRLGFSVSAKRIDNLDFRSERTAIDNVYYINFVPANTKQHTYRLLTLYPYAVQMLGEWGFQSELIYSLKRGSKLGGKYGTSISLNFATARNLDKKEVATDEGYTAEFFAIGGRTYYQDFNIEINRKLSKKWKAIFTYAYLEYDKDQIEGRTGFGLVKSHTVVADVQYKHSSKLAFRSEVQHLATEQDFGNWVYGLLETTIKSNFSFYLSNEMNYVGTGAGKPKAKHYYDFGASYVKGASRFGLSYGRQRAGLLCVGGICRIVPASSGLSFSLTSTF